MRIKLVADSSANINVMSGVDFESVPLKIVVGDEEYTDNANLAIGDMLKALKEYKGKTSTACPGVQEWINAFGNADVVFGVAITSGLSGCYNAAKIAAEEYMEANPGAKVFMLDSLSTGPEMELILEKYQGLIAAGKSFEEIRDEVKEYSKNTHLMFSLETLSNFAKNGRVSPAVAAAVGLLGIRVVGRASDEGTLEPMHKCRGEKKALQQILTTMKELGYAGGKVRIAHSYNPEAAEKLRDLIYSEFPESDIAIRFNRGLCCYYAEEGGILIGFEG